MTFFEKGIIIIQYELFRSVKMKKALFFDIDGTIVVENENFDIPQSTINALKKAKENGHYLFINSGRTYFNIEERIRNLGFDGYLCGCGTHIELNGTELLYNTLSPELCKKIIELNRKCNAIPLYERRDNVFFDTNCRRCDELEEFRDYFIKIGSDVNLPIDNADFYFDKFVIWSDSDTDMELFRKEASEYFSIIDRGNGFYENIPLGFSKATAIDVILKKLDIPYENAYALGDSTNDLPMLQAVPNSIAMGQGTSIHKYVSFVTKNIEDDGIEYALKHFGII